MKLLVKVVPLMMLVVFTASMAFALPVIGVRTSAVGAFSYADIWTQATDSGVAEGFQDFYPVPPNAAYQTTFTGQSAVLGLQKDGLVVSTPWLNSTHEITAVTKLKETVVASGTYFDFFGNFHQAATFTGPGFQSVDKSSTVEWYLDDITDGSVHHPGNNGGTVNNYGAGVTSVHPSDGVKIMSAYLVALATTFDFNFTTGIGTGSYDLLWRIDWFDPNYIDLSNPGGLPQGNLLRSKFTGTTNIPSFYNPDVMWDGTPSVGATLGPDGVTMVPNILMKVDGSQTFDPIPEPSTFVLLGAGLAGLGFLRTYRKRS